MKILCINQFVPPDPAPTGILLAELAERLRARGHEVEFVSSQEDYRGAQKQAGGRMRRELLALWRMLRAALKCRRVDVVISLTSPPCLVVVAALAALWHRARHLHWVMDLYPEIAVALGEVRGGGPLARLVGWAAGWSYRRCDRVVTLDEDMSVLLRRHRVEPEVIRVWVFESVLAQLAKPLIEPIGAWTWIYSGNLGRAHEWETLLAAQARIEAAGLPIRLLFQGGGPSRPAAEARTREMGLRQVDFAGYVPEAEVRDALLRCHCLVVTQRPETQGMLWPSKLGLVLALPRPVLWIGPTHGAIARLLASQPHAGAFAPGDDAAVADWVIARYRSEEKTSAVFDPRAHREAALARWEALVQQGVAGGLESSR